MFDLADPHSGSTLRTVGADRSTKDPSGDRQGNAPGMEEPEALKGVTNGANAIKTYRQRARKSRRFVAPLLFSHHAQHFLSHRVAEEPAPGRSFQHYQTGRILLYFFQHPHLYCVQLDVDHRDCKRSTR